MIIEIRNWRYKFAMRERYQKRIIIKTNRRIVLDLNEEEYEKKTNDNHRYIDVCAPSCADVLCLYRKCGS